MHLGEIIKEYRAIHKISMDEFSRQTQLSRAYISILERNVNPVNNKPPIPSLETIRVVAKAVGLDFSSVINMLESPQTVSLASLPPAATPQPQGIDLALWSMVQDMTDKQKEEVLRFAKFVKEQK